MIAASGIGSEGPWWAALALAVVTAGRSFMNGRQQRVKNGKGKAEPGAQALYDKVSDIHDELNDVHDDVKDLKGRMSRVERKLDEETAR